MICESPRDGAILTLHGVVFAILRVGPAAHAEEALQKPVHSLSTALRSGSTVTTGDPQ